MNLQRFVGRKAKDAELAEEIQSHLAHDEDLRRARGVDAEEARRQARVKLGGQNTVREGEWRYRSLAWVENLLRDLKLAAYQFGGAGLNLTGGDHPLQVQGVYVSQQYFDMLGAPVIAGRTFTQA